TGLIYPFVIHCWIMAIDTVSLGPFLSIIIPAYNEELYLPQTLAHIYQANAYLQAQGAPAAEVLVVNNASTDRTAHRAQAAGATVVPEPAHNIAKVRNTGARAARGDVFIFIDVDTLVPEPLLWLISRALSDPRCIGGAVDTE